MRFAQRRFSVVGSPMVLAQSGGAITYSVERDRLPDASATAKVERWPLAVGVHYAPGVLEAVHGREGWRVPSGAAVTSTVGWVLDQMFAERIDIPELPPFRAAPPGVAGIVVLASVTGSGPPESITVHFELLSRDGIVVYRWEATGKGAPLPVASVSDAFTIVAKTEVTWAIRDAIAAFMVGFAAQPRVCEWLAANGVAPTGPEPVYQASIRAPPGGTPLAFAPEAREWRRYGDLSNARQCIGDRLEGLAPPVRSLPFDRLRLEFLSRARGCDRAEGRRRHAALRRSSCGPPQARGARSALPRLFRRQHGHRLRSRRNAVRGGACWGGCFGFSWGTRASSFNATVVDLRDAVQIATEAASRTIGVSLPALVVPVPLIGATESVACQELAERVHRIVTGKTGAGPPPSERGR